MSSCKKYNFYPYELIFPSLDIIYKQCEIRDKTNLFIVSLMRLLLSIIFYHVVKEYLVMQVIMIFIIIFNIILLMIVFFKMPLVVHNDLDINIDETTKLVERSRGRTLADQVLMPDDLAPRPDWY